MNFNKVVDEFLQEDSTTDPFDNIIDNLLGSTDPLDQKTISDALGVKELLVKAKPLVQVYYSEGEWKWYCETVANNFLDEYLRMTPEQIAADFELSWRTIGDMQKDDEEIPGAFN